MRHILAALGMALVLAYGVPAGAQGVQRIAAVVNDDAISIYDLFARLRMIILTSGLPDTSETRNRLAPQVLRALIDERLQMQEAQRLNIGVQPAEVDEALQRLGNSLNLPENGIDNLLQQANIPMQTLEDQIRAQIAWQKVVAQRLGPNVRIGDDEVEDYMSDLRANQGQPEYRVGEIFLSVDDPSNEVAVRDRARALVDQIREGANFQALAQQFSQSSAAATGGDLGWVRLDQLPEEIAQAIRSVERGQIADPVRTTAGYHIVVNAGMRNEAPVKSEPTVSLQQVVLPFGAGVDEADRQAQIELAQTVGGIVEGCDDLASAGRELGAQVSQRLSDLRMSELAATMRTTIDGLAVGQTSEPVVQERGVALVMVCSRGDDDGLPSTQQVRQVLTNEKLNLLARRYMRDLRNAAFVDVRV